MAVSKTIDFHSRIAEECNGVQIFEFSTAKIKLDINCYICSPFFTLLGTDCLFSTAIILRILNMKTEREIERIS